MDRLEEIALGAALAITVSWLVTLVPMRERAPDPLRPATLRVLGYVNRRHGLAYRLARRLPSGDYIVRDAQGEAVLRWSRNPSDPVSTADSQASGATPSGFPYAVSSQHQL